MAKEPAKTPTASKPSDDQARLQLVGFCLTGLLGRQYPEPPEVVAEKARDYADAALAALSSPAKPVERN